MMTISSLSSCQLRCDEEAPGFNTTWLALKSASPLTGPSLRYQRPSTALAYWDGYPVMFLWGMASISNLGTGVSPSGQNRAAGLTGADGHHTPVIANPVGPCNHDDCLPLTHP